ncbi:MAG: ABC transporter ATP-binding protein [Simkaniaceae bacterium]|nr:ABC transporter ATP-binding protein [Simkaniaceae bacterium]MCF7852351.1 ABC transporter ATP-binding protein [Simkaniaceae bacterium]
MRSIHLKDVTKSKDGEVILKNVNLSIPAGKFFALLGPSGCGKTTLLRLIAGLETVDSGSIYIGNHNVTHLPVNKRKVNIVFQNYALFPHLTVFENIAYSLVIENRPKEDIRERVMKLLKAFDLEPHTHRLPKELSGGQQQRVALARAIVNEPEVLLLDEPLAALDYKLREKMLIELIDLQEKLSTTFIYVTHDQFEALTVADQMAIMNHDGDIEQIGTPEQIYEFPTSSFVAKFVGSTNIYKGILHEVDNDTKIDIPDFGRFSIKVPSNKPWLKSGCLTTLTIRPEKIFLSKKPVENFSNTVEGTVSDIVYHGRSTLYIIKINDKIQVQVFEQNEDHFPKEMIDYDDKVFLYWQKENVVLLQN